MSVFDTIDDRTLSPVKVAWNLAADVLTTGDFPSWKQINEAFSKHDTSSLPQVQFTNSSGYQEAHWQRAVRAGSVNLTISRAGDIDVISEWKTGG